MAQDEVLLYVSLDGAYPTSKCYELWGERYFLTNFFAKEGVLQTWGTPREKNDMSDLKYKNLEELSQYKIYCEAKIRKHGSIKAGQEERLKWINHYIDKREQELVPVEMTVEEIEERLGHRIKVTS